MNSSLLVSYATFTKKASNKAKRALKKGLRIKNCKSFLYLRGKGMNVYNNNYNQHFIIDGNKENLQWVTSHILGWFQNLAIQH